MEQDELYSARELMTPSKDVVREDDTPSSEAILSRLKDMFGLGNAHLPPEESVVALVQALDDAAWQRRAAAARRLGEVGGEEAMSALQARLATEKHPPALAAIIRAVGELRIAESEPTLLALLSHEESMVRDAAAQALGQTAGQLSAKAIDALIESFFIEEDEEARAAVVAALGKLGKHWREDVLEALEAALQDEAWQVREAAALALGEQKDLLRLTHIEALEMALDDEAVPVSQAAIYALSKILAEEEQFSGDSGSGTGEGGSGLDEGEVETSQEQTDISVTKRDQESAAQQQDTQQETRNRHALTVDGVEFIPLLPTSIRDSLGIVSQAFDDQWMPTTLLRAVLNGKISYQEAQPYLDYLVRTEYIRSLINGERLVVNRAFIYNNPWLYRDFLPGSPARKAFQAFLEKGVIIPFLFNEPGPVTLPPWISARQDGFTAWVNLCKETLLQCMRLSWDDQQNLKEAQNALSFQFHSFAISANAGNVEKFLEGLGLDPAHANDFVQRLDDVQEASLRYFREHQRQHVVRTFLYEQFITRGNPTLRQYDGSRPYAGAIKQLLDLAYNSNLADALDCHLLTPLDSPTRLVLQEWNRVSRRAEKMEASALVDMVRKDIFQIVRSALDRESLKSVGLLNLQDVQALRAMDEWQAYITTLRQLLKEPLRFEEFAGTIAMQYALLTDRMTDLIRERNLRQGGALTALWSPGVEVTLTVGGVDTSILWNREGIISNAPVSRDEIAGTKKRIQVDPSTRDAACSLRFTITDGTHASSHARLASRVDFFNGRMEDAREQWEEVVRKLGELLKPQEFAAEAEQAPTMNWQEVGK